MQYLVSVVDDGTGLATPTENAAIDVFNERLQAEGYWVFAGGLGSPDPAIVIDNRGAYRRDATGVKRGDGVGPAPRIADLARSATWSVCLESVGTSCGPPTRWPWGRGIAIA